MVTWLVVPRPVLSRQKVMKGNMCGSRDVSRQQKIVTEVVGVHLVALGGNQTANP